MLHTLTHKKTPKSPFHVEQIVLQLNQSVLGATVLLITPPFTQLNTPYPATAYLKGFLNTKSIASFQADLGIEVTVALFSKPGLTTLFERVDARHLDFSRYAERPGRLILR